MSKEYLAVKKLTIEPRIPLEGSIDLTYRCNNNCRHCWLRIPPDAKEKEEELSFEEIKNIIDEARKMGCRRWVISGGEPMLRPDFSDIFDYITKKCAFYSLNTNGTLITSKIADLLKRKGSKMIALYGATAETHDYITRQPGSFEALMRGFSYLKEAGAGFIVQIVPMRGNYHELNDMVDLAKSLSKDYRIGASWLFLSAYRDPEVNKEIIRQRLSPKEAFELDKPDLSRDDFVEKHALSYKTKKGRGYLFSYCIDSRRNFHIDSYGRMSFCCYIKTPELRYDLRKGSIEECWEKFIPLLANKMKITREYRKGCGSCEYMNDCRWCPVYAYLEHGDFNAKIDYLCEIAKENKRFKEDWKKNHRRYFNIADITIQVDSDLAINENTFHPKFKIFEAKKSGKDIVKIKHHFSLPELGNKSLGVELYRRPPWAIYKKGDSWIYLGISPVKGDERLHRAAVFNRDHTRARIYSNDEKTFARGGLRSLSLFPTDQILLARVLADKDGCFLHSSGVILGGKGLLFVGHSEAGKSTMATMLKDDAEILCDDRIIVRKNAKGFRIYGTWSHGDVPDVSANSAPLKALFFLNKAKENRIELIRDKREINKKLLDCLIKPFVTADWWAKEIELIDDISCKVPSYMLYFNKEDKGKILELLKKL